VRALVRQEMGMKLFVVLGAVVVWFFGAVGFGQTQEAGKPRFDAGISRERQMELAMSAAPAEVSAKATIYVLGRNGYEKAREGSNGFSCLVAREYVTTQEPECFDAEGSATLLVMELRREEMRAQGKSEAEIAADSAEAYRTGKFFAPRKPGICYMLSTENWVFDPSQKKVIQFPGHLMFYAPYMTAHDLGYESQAALPFLVAPGTPGALMVVVPAAQSGGHDHGGANGSDSHK
jgi:hypothetical protein